MLRRLATSDLRAFQAYRHDPQLGRFQGWAPTPDEDAREFLRHMSLVKLLQPGVWCQIGIADASTLELIGDIGLNLASDSLHAEIGFTLRQQSQGRGLATAAVKDTIRLLFDHTPAEKVVGIADERNDSSIRLLARVGMCKVDTRQVMSGGERCTEFVYAIGRDDDG